MLLCYVMIIDSHWRSDGCIVAISGSVDVSWHGLTNFFVLKAFLQKEIETKRCLTHLGHFALRLRWQDFHNPTADFEG